MEETASVATYLLIVLQITSNIVPYARDFVPVMFFSGISLKKLCFQLLQNVTWTSEIMQMTRHNWGKIGPSINMYISCVNMVTYLFIIVIFGTIQGKLKKMVQQFLFLRNYLKLV